MRERVYVSGKAPTRRRTARGGIQNDFLPGGSLAVPKGDEIVPVLARYVDRFLSRGLPIFATRDWHPPNHCSFKEWGGIWPVHCVAGTRGAEPPPGFNLPSSAVIVPKATSADKEAYSGFQGTVLDERLRAAGVHRLFVGGLATDYCVLNTVNDALNLGYDVVVLTDGIRAINVHPNDGRDAEEEMLRRGAQTAQWKDLSG